MPSPRYLLLFTLATALCFAQDEPPRVDGQNWGGKAQKQAPQIVPVVKTFAALSQVKPIEIGEDIKIRLGIEAAEAPVYSGVLVYAQVDGFHVNEQDDPDTQLGPLKMEVKPEAEARRRIEVGPGLLRQPANWDGTALFCRVLTLRAPGDYTIRFLTHSGTEVATATVRATSAKYHAWSVFHSVRWNEIEEAPQDGVLTGYLAYSRFDPGVPYLSGADPLQVIPEAMQKRETPLPRLQDTLPAVVAAEVPEQIARVQALIKALSEDDFDLRENASLELRSMLPDVLPQLEKARSRTPDVETRSRLEGLIRSALAATLHIQATSHEATLTFPGGLHASWPEDYYLARWWINDKPVMLEANRDIQELQKVGAMRMGEQMRLRWKIDWNLLGAKSGDRVALQVMYCPAGVRKVLQDGAELRMAPILEFGQKPVLSNRTEFVLP